MTHKFKHNIDKMVFENFIKTSDDFDLSDFPTNALEVFAKWVAEQSFLEGMEYQRAINETKKVA